MFIKKLNNVLMIVSVFLFLAACNTTTIRSTKTEPVLITGSAIPEALLESELFGHRKGSFTGANESHIGLLEAANAGTLLLDEIGDMPLPFQAKLLRALQEHEIRPVGSTQARPIDVRGISATHLDLEKAVAEGRFREDLYHRLAVILIQVPSLNDRRDDIPMLINYFSDKISFPSASKIKIAGCPGKVNSSKASCPSALSAAFNDTNSIASLYCI